MSNETSIINFNEEQSEQERLQQKATEFAASLREAADYIEKHPEVTPEYREYISVTKPVKAIAQAFRSPGWEKRKSSYTGFYITRTFGDRIIFNIQPENAVCEKVKVGEHEVEEVDPEYLENAPKVTKMVEDYEYKCPDYLSQLKEGGDN